MADGFIFVSRIQMFLIFMDVLKEGVRIEDSESTMFADVNVLCGGKYVDTAEYQDTWSKSRIQQGK